MRDAIETARTWAIVLAGGDGSRLAQFTESLHGCPVPKQFATITGDRSMLQLTLQRVACLVPPRRTLIVVAGAHLRWASPQLVAYPEATVLAQPANLGTATALVYALSWIRARDPDGHVVLFPSDHFVAHQEPFVAAVRLAEITSRSTGMVTLLGVRPEGRDPDYGWIVQGDEISAGARRVRGFVEKPALDDARRLLAAGALWNTFLLAAPAAGLWDLTATHLPRHAASFAHLGAAPGLDAVYTRLPAADFSRDVLERAGRLAVVPMVGAGWSDWGTPARVLASLEGSAAHATVRARLRGEPITIETERSVS